jgi:hypothetical protein
MDVLTHFRSIEEHTKTLSKTSIPIVSETLSKKINISIH